MRRSIGGTSLYKTDYQQLLLQHSSQISLDKTFIKRLFPAEKGTPMERIILNKLIHG